MTTVTTSSPETSLERAARVVRQSSNGDGLFFMPGRKRPVAYTSGATSRLIGLLAEDGLTFIQAREAINFDDEAIAVLDIYIGRGFGDVSMYEFGMRY